MKFKVWVETNKIGSRTETEIELDDQELEECGSDEEREKYIEEVAMDAMHEMIDWSYEPIED